LERRVKILVVSIVLANLLFLPIVPFAQMLAVTVPVTDNVAFAQVNGWTSVGCILFGAWIPACSQFYSFNADGSGYVAKLNGRCIVGLSKEGYPSTVNPPITIEQIEILAYNFGPPKGIFNMTIRNTSVRDITFLEIAVGGSVYDANVTRIPSGQTLS
jgi:hypothetical protein